MKRRVATRQVLGRFLPVDEELLSGGVQEGEACAVGRLLSAVEQRVHTAHGRVELAAR